MTLKISLAGVGRASPVTRHSQAKEPNSSRARTRQHPTTAPHQAQVGPSGELT